MTFGFVPLQNGFGHEISMTVGFAGFRDFNDGRFCSVTRSQWRSFFLLRDFKNSRFCFVTSFQWRSVLVGYMISVMVGFGGL